MKVLSERLKEKSLKVTPQRLSIYYYLYNTNKHPSAEIIYKELEPDYPSMSLATVYKTLDVLKKANLVRELNVGEDSFRYDANMEIHSHLVCSSCNSVIDVVCDAICNDTKKDLENKNGFIIESEQIYFFGTCKCCKEKMTILT